jgi:septal ring factor EnvC (AmiA/AmiB activator)
MPKPLGRRATRDLTGIGLELSHRRARGDWLARCALATAGMLVGAAALHLVETQWPGPTPLEAATQDREQMQRQLEQGQLSLRVSEARSQELERQVGALVQQLRECREELTFFRNGRDGKP